MLLRCGNLTIRNATVRDASQLAAWWNDGRIMAHAGFPNGTGQTAEEIAAGIARDADGTHRRLIVEIDGFPAGEMMYENLGGGTAEIGIKICDPSKQEKGYGKIVLSLLISSLFHDLGFQKIVLDTNVKNTRAQHVYERLGFRKTRVWENAWKDQLGRSQSSVDYELVPDDFVNFAGKKHIKLSGGCTVMEKKEQLYEGKAKKVYATGDPDLVIVSYKDDATAFDGTKKGTIRGKGAVNNRMSNFLMGKLAAAGIPTHFVEELNDRETVVKKVQIVPLEVIIRNVSAGSFAKRYGVEEGIPFDEPTFEFSYKNDDLHDPLLNTSHALALKLATREEIDTIRAMALKVNEVLKAFFAECGVRLIDFKLEFGRLPDGTIVLADEISPDTCRFWDAKTNEKLDKDRFRRDLGNVEEAYEEMMRRVFGA